MQHSHKIWRGKVSTCSNRKTNRRFTKNECHNWFGFGIKKNKRLAASKLDPPGAEFVSLALKLTKQNVIG
jgi:hypothetical protein